MQASPRRQPRSSSSHRAQAPSPLSWLAEGLGNSLPLLLLLTALLVSGLAVIYLTHRDRVMFNELQQLKNDANALGVQWGQLLIEQSTFGLEGRVETKATEQLNMRLPEIDSIVMVRQ